MLFEFKISYSRAGSLKIKPGTSSRQFSSKSMLMIKSLLANELGILLILFFLKLTLEIDFMSLKKSSSISVRLFFYMLMILRFFKFLRLDGNFEILF